MRIIGTLAFRDDRNIFPQLLVERAVFSATGDERRENELRVFGFYMTRY